MKNIIKFVVILLYLLYFFYGVITLILLLTSYQRQTTLDVTSLLDTGGPKIFRGLSLCYNHRI
jgi:hypothetical protein